MFQYGAARKLIKAEAETQGFEIRDEMADMDDDLKIIYNLHKRFDCWSCHESNVSIFFLTKLN